MVALIKDHWASTRWYEVPNSYISEPMSSQYVLCAHKWMPITRRPDGFFLLFIWQVSFYQVLYYILLFSIFVWCRKTAAKRFSVSARCRVETDQGYGVNETAIPTLSKLARFHLRPLTYTRWDRSQELTCLNNKTLQFVKTGLKSSYYNVDKRYIPTTINLSIDISTQYVVKPRNKLNIRIQISHTIY